VGPAIRAARCWSFRCCRSPSRPIHPSSLAPRVPRKADEIADDHVWGGVSLRDTVDSPR
jgi:hypothetical protein